VKSHKAVSAPVVALQLKSVLRQGLIGAAVFSGVINILALIGPVFMLEVYDRVIPSQSIPTLIALGLLVLGVYALSGLFGYRAFPGHGQNCFLPRSGIVFSGLQRHFRRLH